MIEEDMRMKRKKKNSSLAVSRTQIENKWEVNLAEGNDSRLYLVSTPKPLEASCNQRGWVLKRAPALQNSGARPEDNWVCVRFVHPCLALAGGLHFLPTTPTPVSFERCSFSPLCLRQPHFCHSCRVSPSRLSAPCSVPSPVKGSWRCCTINRRGAESQTVVKFDLSWPSFYFVKELSLWSCFPAELEEPANHLCPTVALPSLFCSVLPYYSMLWGWWWSERASEWW